MGYLNSIIEPINEYGASITNPTWKKVSQIAVLEITRNPKGNGSSKWSV
ncbi:hypothetical protein VCRA2123O444_90094 [Vibrio crassostreae]|nr:hypothetical protein VCRA2119O430_100073 [Vibrio crassostreae]CAK1701906.1 hypothetical protein VCRA2113O409_100093 [Vibrio crassostreae]CAK1716493.1 hypothetical protein VCRA2117O428_110073 [Vibrio crassostreae]CAK1717300.1 hypothetical protein VCRA2113O416_110072 [Vibrio crassostreae]CAK1719846.1 hypothetical protein VCRA2113O411_110074 [Vibrio crassostreae]